MNTIFSLTRKIIKIALIASMVIFVITLYPKDKIPEKDEILKNLYQDPVQTETTKEPFEVEKNGITYTITPFYDYELNGMIVSYNNSSNWLDYYHEKWEDFLNMKDICVIWGENVETEIHKKMKFNNGSWTCYFEFKPDTNNNDWSQFKNENLSNNHLLSNSEEINKKIMSVEKGDQIYLKGYLVKYAKKDRSFERGTSATRTDQGNGACETIYVEDFQILKKANPELREIHLHSQYVIGACLALLMILLFKD